MRAVTFSRRSTSALISGPIPATRKSSSAGQGSVPDRLTNSAGVSAMPSEASFLRAASGEREQAAMAVEEEEEAGDPNAARGPPHDPAAAAAATATSAQAVRRRSSRIEAHADA